VRHAPLALVALLLTVSFIVPQALANPAVVRPLQAGGSMGSPGVPCMSFNGVDDSYIPKIVSGLRIALIQPVLTSTPYSQVTNGSFYTFYAKEAGVTTNVTTNLNLLSTNVSSGYGYYHGWGLSYGTYLFFNSVFAESCGLQLGKNVQVLTDMDVANGGLFDPQNHSSRFDVVVLPFSEYVEASEYLAYEDFVAGGGTLVMMAHSLEYQVTYNATTDVETFVYGHGWEFNGRYAYPIACGSGTDASCPWAENSTDWIGSNSCLESCYLADKYLIDGSTVNLRDPMGMALSKEFGDKVFKLYVSHEEDTVTNMTDTSIVAVLLNDSTHLVASYTHHFRRGTVVNFGLFGDDIIQRDPSARYFVLLGVVLGRSAPASTLTNSTASNESTTSLTSSTSTPASSTTVLTSSAKTDTSLTAVNSTLEQTQTSAAAASKSLGALPSVLVAIGGVAVIVVVAGAVVLRRKQAGPGG
jgi:hypothetical protein